MDFRVVLVDLNVTFLLFLYAFGHGPSPGISAFPLSVRTADVLSPVSIMSPFLSRAPA